MDQHVGYGHSNDQIGGLNGSPPCELPLSESSCCFPSSGWWAKTLSAWACKLVLTCIVVDTQVVTYC